ncbi:Uncharacterised protein [Neisseria meningitidis]|nr:Uncharacterised protein [Neisseria meningitidis]
MNLMFNVSVGDARADIGFEFIVEFEIVNGGQAERRNGVEAAVSLMFCLGFFVVVVYLFSNFFSRRITFFPFSVTGIICRYSPAAEIIADRHPGVDGMRTDVSEIIAYRACVVCTGCLRIIVGNAFGGIS